MRPNYIVRLAGTDEIIAVAINKVRAGVGCANDGGPNTTLRTISIP